MASPNHQEFIAKTKSIAAEVAAPHAADVDQRARFPHETFDTLRKAKLLGVAAPREVGGEGSTLQDLATMCTILAQACGSSGMILAMHHIQVACVARHGFESPYFRDYLRHVVESQSLLASVTSEVGVWGDTRSSICALEREGGRFKLVKDATTLSYAEAADDLLATCRRNPDAPGSDQILVLLRKGRLHAHADRRLGHARHARHVQPRLQGRRDRLDRPGRPGLLRRRLGADDGPVLAHPVVGRLARHRDGRLRASERVCAGRGAQDARHDAGEGHPPRQARGLSSGHAQPRDRAGSRVRRDDEAPDRNG